MIFRYGMFGSMHDERWEIMIEGSYDKVIWERYIFHYKINSPDDNGSFLPIYYWPRLDWMIWFLPLRVNNDPPFWFNQFLFYLLQNEKDVCNLLKVNPFDGKNPPKYVRAIIFDYKIKDKNQDVSKTKEEILPLNTEMQYFRVPSELQNKHVGQYWVSTGPVVTYVGPNCIKDPK